MVSNNQTISKTEVRVRIAMHWEHGEVQVMVGVCNPVIVRVNETSGFISGWTLKTALQLGWQKESSSCHSSMSQNWEVMEKEMENRWRRQERKRKCRSQWTEVKTLRLHEFSYLVWSYLLVFWRLLFFPVPSLCGSSCWYFISATRCAWNLSMFRKIFYKVLKIAESIQLLKFFAI